MSPHRRILGGAESFGVTTTVAVEADERGKRVRLRVATKRVDMRATLDTTAIGKLIAALELARDELAATDADAKVVEIYRRNPPSGGRVAP